MLRKAFLSATAVVTLAGSPSVFADAPRLDLPMDPPPFTGVIRDTMGDSTPSRSATVQAPEGVPNVFLMMADDVGFSMSSTFGGPVPTPNMDRLAAAGLRYNSFHTSGICSPSRAALLTGRNPHKVGTGHIVDLSAGYPGYNGHFPRSAATIAQTLRLNGYSTAMVGKHHNIPPGEATAAGPFDMWPTGLGFEYFYGILGGSADQFHTNFYRGTDRANAPADPVLFEKRIADDAMRWLHDHILAAPNKPFFMYYAPASAHAPQQAPASAIARFKGKFDQGWDRLREETYQRQLAQGIIPPGTQLTPRPATIPTWASLSPAEKRFSARGMEVAAAMLVYQDEQIGRVLDELDRTGKLQNTLVIVIQGDNGASGDGKRAGTTEQMAVADVTADPAWMAAITDAQGSQLAQGSYASGWGWAMNAPFPFFKSHAGMLGGIRNGMIVSWKGHVATPGAICSQFGHLVDIAPTLFEAAEIPAPATVYGVKQMPLDGESLVKSFSECKPEHPRTQYFEVGGKAGLYSNGWFLSTETLTAGLRRPDEWALYDLRSDFSQANDVSGKYPERRQALFNLWHDEAKRNNVLPIREGFVSGAAPSAPRDRYEFWGNDISILAHSEGRLTGGMNRTFTIDAEVDLRPRSSGVVLSVGGRFAGWSLSLDQGRPNFVYASSIRPAQTLKFSATRTLPAGLARLRLRFVTAGPGKPAQFELFSNDQQIAAGDIPVTFNMVGAGGETFDAGRDTGIPVTAYPTAEGTLQGQVRHITLKYD